MPTLNYGAIVQRLRSDAETYQMMAKFRGVPDTPLGRTLLMAADNYILAADAIDALRADVESAKGENRQPDDCAGRGVDETSDGDCP